MGTILTVLLAVAVPIGWGLFSAWAFDAWRARCDTRATEKGQIQRKDPA